MAQFDYRRTLQRLMTPEVMSALGNVREHRGKQALYLATNDPARPWLRFEFTGSVSPAKEVEGR